MLIHVINYTIRGKINFPWCAEALQKNLKQMDFKWKKYVNRRKVLMEHPHILV
jgi:hypothetical protein